MKIAFVSQGHGKIDPPVVAGSISVWTFEIINELKESHAIIAYEMDGGSYPWPKEIPRKCGLLLRADAIQPDRQPIVCIRPAGFEVDSQDMNLSLRNLIFYRFFTTWAIYYGWLGIFESKGAIWSMSTNILNTCR